VGKAYSKTGVPYFGAAIPIELQDVDEKHLKLENPNRGNIMVTMKKKLKTSSSLPPSPQTDRASIGSTTNP
jgi:hypothetical protein